MANDMKKGLMVQYPYSRGRAFVCKNIGDYIEENDTLMELHTNKKINIKDISTEAFLIKNEPPIPVNLIYKVIK